MHERDKIVHFMVALIDVVLIYELVSKIAIRFVSVQSYQTCQISGIFWISGIATVKHWIFLSFVDFLLLFLEKSKVIFRFSGIKQVHRWYV